MQISGRIILKKVAQGLNCYRCIVFYGGTVTDLLAFDAIGGESGLQLCWLPDSPATSQNHGTRRGNRRQLPWLSHDRIEAAKTAACKSGTLIPPVVPAKQMRNEPI
jgi:hypothetical protein